MATFIVAAVTVVGTLLIAVSPVTGICVGTTDGVAGIEATVIDARRLVAIGVVVTFVVDAGAIHADFIVETVYPVAVIGHTGVLFAGLVPGTAIVGDTWVVADAAITAVAGGAGDRITGVDAGAGDAIGVFAISDTVALGVANPVDTGFVPEAVYPVAVIGHTGVIMTTFVPSTVGVGVAFIVTVAAVTTLPACTTRILTGIATCLIDTFGLRAVGVVDTRVVTDPVDAGFAWQTVDVVTVLGHTGVLVTCLVPGAVII